VTWAAAAATVSLLVPLAVGAWQVPRSAAEVYTGRPADAPMPQLASPAASQDPRKPTAVVVLGSEGTNVADALPPFEVLARTQRFNLYTVAAERRPMPLTGGLDLVPDLSFAELDDLVPATPEVIVVPQITGERSGGPVTTWVEQQHRQGEPLLVSVCVGAEVLANAGLLDGRPATSHWLKLIGLRRDFPAVDWRADRRYVEDGQLITSAGVLSGVDGALRVVERLVGPAGAERAASAVHWPHYSPGRPAAITPVRPAAGDLVALLSAAYRWDRPTMGVLLTDGVTETELASALRPYTELSYITRPRTISLDGGPVRTRHGLNVLPRADLKSALPHIDSLVVPGATAAQRKHLPSDVKADYLHDQPGYAFDGSLRHIAKTEDAATARWVAKSLHYPLPELNGSEPAWPWALVARPLLVLSCAGGGLALIRSLRPGRRPDVTRTNPT
jgi:transcriptional regulator GlxA family with amidase domain